MASKGVSPRGSRGRGPSILPRGAGPSAVSRGLCFFFKDSGDPGASEDVAQATAEAGQQVFAIEGIVGSKLPYIADRPIGEGLGLAGIDHPDKAHAGFEVFPDLVEDVAGSIAGRQNLDREIRRCANEIVWVSLRRGAHSGDKAHIGCPHVAAGETKVSLPLENGPQSALAHEDAQPRQQLRAHRAVPAPTW